MSDQEWIIERMFQICNNDREIEEFNTGSFSKDSLGQYLLRISLRRKCERDVKIELINSKGSKKALIDKLFSVLTIWNIRASYCDLKVMIKDTTPGKGTKYHQQNTIVADALMKEISRSCRDFFFSAEKLNEIKAPQISMFEFSDLNAYWLISELLDLVQPENVTKSIKALFLEEMLNLISTTQLDEDEKIKRLKQSAKLLGEQPFINIILTCQANEDKGRESLVQAMLSFCQEIMSKYEKKPELAIGNQYELERESMLLRLNLIGGMIDFNTTTPDVISSYAISLCNLLMNEAITKERDGTYFYHVYDMLTICVYSFFSGPGVIQYNEKAEVIKTRFPDYASFLKKFKREFSEKQIELKLNCIQQLLPIKENYGELQIFNDTYSLGSPSKNIGSKNNPMSNAYSKNIKNIRIDKFSEPAQKRILRMIYHTHQNDFITPGIPGKPLLNQQLETFAIGLPDYTETPKQLNLPPRMMPNHPMQQQLNRPNLPLPGGPNQQPFYSGQNPIMERPQMYPAGPPVSGPPNTNQNIIAGNFPGGPIASTPTSSGMPPNFPTSQPMQQPISNTVPMPQNQPNYPNMPMPQPGFPPRMQIPDQMIRQMRPGTQVKKRPSATSLAPTGQRMKRIRKDTEVPQHTQPQHPGNMPPTMPAPSQFQQQWNQGLPQQPPPQQQFNVNPQQQAQPRFNVPQNQQQETKEILRSTLQKKKNNKQGIQQQIPQGQMPRPQMMPQQHPMSMQGQRMPMNMPQGQPPQMNPMSGPQQGQYHMPMPNQQQQPPPHNMNPHLRH